MPSISSTRAAGSCRVTNTPEVLTEDVADLGMALLLAASRQLCLGDRFVRQGRWARREGLPLARKVSGKRLGILGMGRIGRAIGRRAEGFGMTIAYTDIRAFDDVPYRHVGDLVQLARDSDFLIVAAAGGPQSAASSIRRCWRRSGRRGSSLISRGGPSWISRRSWRH